MADVAVVAHLGTIKDGLEFGCHQVVKGGNEQNAVRGLQRIAHAAEADAAKERQFHHSRAGHHQDGERVHAVLDNAALRDQGQRAVQCVLVERRCPEETKSSDTR